MSKYVLYFYEKSPFLASDDEGIDPLCQSLKL